MASMSKVTMLARVNEILSFNSSLWAYTAAGTCISECLFAPVAALLLSAAPAVAALAYDGASLDRRRPCLFHVGIDFKHKRAAARVAKYSAKPTGTRESRMPLLVAAASFETALVAVAFVTEADITFWRSDIG